MNTSQTNLQKQSPLDKKMLALVALTLVSSVIGGWPFIVLAAVFVYTQIIVKIPLISIGVLLSAVIGLFVTVPIITSIIRNSAQLVKLSTRIGYFLLIGLSTFSTAGGVYNGTHNIIATIIAGFAVIVIVALIFNDSENNNFSVIPQKYTGPDSPIPKKLIPEAASDQIYMGSIIALISFLVAIIWFVAESSMIKSSLESTISFDTIFQITNVKIILFLVLPMIILGWIINYFIAINNVKKQSLEARDRLSRLLTKSQIQKLQVAISDILQHYYEVNSKADYIKNGNTFAIVSSYLRIKSTLTEVYISDTMEDLMLAYPNRFKNYTADEFNQVLNKFVKD